MRDNKFKKYLAFQGISKAQAAKEIGCSRQYVYDMLRGNSVGKKMALRVEGWSDGFIRATHMMGLD
jgi:DNA-binding XRE family transcriptional regulator